MKRSVTIKSLLRINKASSLVVSVMYLFIIWTLSGCEPDSYKMYVEFKKGEARNACNNLLAAGYIAVPYLIEALGNDKPYIGYYGHGSMFATMETLGDFPFLYELYYKRFSYQLSDDRYFVGYNWYSLVESGGIDIVKQSLLLDIPKDLVLLSISERPRVSLAAHMLLSKIFKTEFQWSADKVESQKKWQEIWDSLKGQKPAIQDNLSRNLTEVIPNLIKQLEYNGPNYDPCAQQQCRLLLAKGPNAAKEILEWSNGKKHFYGMAKVEVNIKTVQDRSDAENFLRSWHIAEIDNEKYIFELKSGEYLLIYTKMDLFEDDQNNSMITDVKDVSYSSHPRTIHAANILLQMVSGKSVEWETGLGSEKKILQKWKEQLK